MPEEVIFPVLNSVIYNPTRTLSQIQFVNGSGAGNFSWQNGNVIPTVNNNGYTVVFTPDDADNFDYTGINLIKNVELTVEKAIPVYSDSAPADLTTYYSYLLSSIELPENWTWETPENTVGDVGTQTHMAIFTPADTDNYHIVTDIEVTISVLPYIHVTGVKFDQLYVHIAVDESRKLNLIIEPEDALNKNLRWLNQYPSIASLDSDGVITGHSVGYTNILVYTVDGSFRAECVVYVLATSSDEDLFIPELKIISNPFIDVVRIVVAVVETRAETRHATSVQIPIQMRIVNAAGVIVHTQMINSADETIHLEHLPAGVYLFIFEKEGQMKTVRVVKN